MSFHDLCWSGMKHSLVFPTGLQANGLKKNIFGRPSPYVKLSIMPSRRHLRSWKQHHGQIAKTSSETNTISPRWTNEVGMQFASLHLQFKGGSWVWNTLVNHHPKSFTATTTGCRHKVRYVFIFCHLVEEAQRNHEVYKVRTSLTGNTYICWQQNGASVANR